MKIGGRDEKALLFGTGAMLAVLLLFIIQGVTSGFYGPKIEIVTVTETSTETSTIMSTGIIAGAVDNSFVQHVLSFSSGNVSTIAGGYETNATVTWERLLCMSGTYYVSGNDSSFIKLLNILYGHSLLQGFSPIAPSGMSVGNLSWTSTVTANDSIAVNSTFGLSAQDFGGNFTATVSAQDLFVHSETNNTWLVSQETWNFVALDIPNDVMMCGG